MYPATACRYRRMSAGANKKRIAATAALIAAVCVFLVFKSYIYTPLKPLANKTAGSISAGIISMLYQGGSDRIIKEAMPVLAWASFERDDFELTPDIVILEFFSAVGRVNLQSPTAVLMSQIPLLSGVHAPVESSIIAPVINILDTPRVVSTVPGEALLCIYNTHTGETYSYTDGVDRLDGKHGGVVTVSEALQEALETKYGIKVARSDKINDHNYNTSYLESEKTARELLAANPGASMLLDIHRDSGKTREQSVVRINGQEVAPILLIVGSDARRPFPAWRQNFAFASKLSDRMNEMYPGLSLGVRVKDGLYNQFLHPQAVLLEMGTSNNSVEEAILSAKLLADVLAELLSE